MQADLWKKVEDLFRAAMAQPPDKRAEFLNQACPADPQIRAEVQSLLDAVQEKPAGNVKPIDPLLAPADKDCPASGSGVPNKSTRTTLYGPTVTGLPELPV